MITIVAGIYTFRDVIPVFFSDKETLARIVIVTNTPDERYVFISKW